MTLRPSSSHHHLVLSRPRGLGRRLWPAAAAVTAGALVAMTLAASGASAAPGCSGCGYTQINMVSNQPGHAPLTDPDLVNAWGLSASPGTNSAPGSPLWVSDNGTDVTTLYSGATATTVNKVALTVSIPSGAPTGQVFNSDSNPNDFVVTDSAGHSGRAVFLFDTEAGSIAGWNPGVGTTPPPSTVAEEPVTNFANAVYKGLAIAQASDGNTYLYAANFRSGRVEVYNSKFMPVQLPGGLFLDPKIPAGYAPFNVQELAGQLYVTYAKQDATQHDDVAGQGHGFVDVFTNDGALVRRLVTRGQLNSPWGLALAPADFGQFSGDLLVGNFGDGHINVYDPNNGARLGELRQANGQPIVIEKTNELLFSAGPDDESNGLLGKIVADS